MQRLSEDRKKEIKKDFYKASKNDYEISFNNYDSHKEIYYDRTFDQKRKKITDELEINYFALSKEIDAEIEYFNPMHLYDGSKIENLGNILNKNSLIEDIEKVMIWHDNYHDRDNINGNFVDINEYTLRFLLKYNTDYSTDKKPYYEIFNYAKDHGYVKCYYDFIKEKLIQDNEINQQKILSLQNEISDNITKLMKLSFELK